MRQLTLRGVAASYRQSSTHSWVHVLHDADLTLVGGSALAVRGPSGSGKSTLLSVIGGMMKPQRGHVLFDDVSIYNLEDNALSRCRGETVGFLFQMDFLLPNYSIHDNLRMALYYSGKYGEGEARITETLDSVGLRHRAHHLPDELSGGERHRAALARAIIHQPSLILADEPTGNLDRENARRILDLLLAQRERGTIVIIATHDDWVASQTERVLFLEEGKLAEAVA